MVPAAYRATYATLETNLANFDSQLQSGAIDPQTPSGSTITAGDLGVADGNRGKALLAPDTLTTVTNTLARFLQLGMNGVVVDIGYPMLLPTFPDSSAYLSFYERVAARVAQDHMVLSVELDPLSASPTFPELHADYDGLTMAEYAQLQREEAQLIIDDLHPTYVTIMDQPSSLSQQLGFPLSTPSAVATLVNEELDGLQVHTTAVGAGIGTWENPAIAQVIATRTFADYLSVHLYPTGHSQLANLQQITEIAAADHKPIVMDETWLSKTDPAGLPRSDSQLVEEKEESWSFWKPLDARFVTAVTQYGLDHHFALVSPYSTGLFFAYVKWTPKLQKTSVVKVRNLAAQRQSANLEAGLFTSVGSAYAAAIKQP